MSERSYPVEVGQNMVRELLSNELICKRITEAGTSDEPNKAAGSSTLK
jgi:hypothetical protein